MSNKWGKLQRVGKRLKNRTNLSPLSYETHKYHGYKISAKIANHVFISTFLFLMSFVLKLLWESVSRKFVGTNIEKNATSPANYMDGLGRGGK